MHDQSRRRPCLEARPLGCVRRTSARAGAYSHRAPRRTYATEACAGLEARGAAVPQAGGRVPSHARTRMRTSTPEGATLEHLSVPEDAIRAHGPRDRPGRRASRPPALRSPTLVGPTLPRVGEQRCGRCARQPRAGDEVLSLGVRHRVGEALIRSCQISCKQRGREQMGGCRCAVGETATTRREDTGIDRSSTANCLHDVYYIHGWTLTGRSRTGRMQE